MLNEIFFRTYAALACLGRDEKGASAVEYGLIVGLIAVAVVATLLIIGTDLDALFVRASNCLKPGAANC